MRSPAGWPWAVPSSGSPDAGCSTRARSDSRATAILAPPGSCSTSSGGLLRSTALHTRSRRRRARCSSADCHRHSRLDSSVANKEERGWFGMAELTNLESKLGEVIGLAMAAQGATQKVSKLDDLDGDLEQELKRMQSEAKAAEERATEVAGSFEGKKTAILEEAREVKQKATQSDAVAAALAAGNSCRALTLARTLQRRTIAAINQHRVDAALQEQLASAVNALVARVHCAPPPVAPVHEDKHDAEHGRGKHKGHDKKHDGDD